MTSQSMVSWNHEGDWKSGAIGSEINDTEPMISLSWMAGFYLRSAAEHREAAGLGCRIHLDVFVAVAPKRHRGFRHSQRNPKDTEAQIMLM